MSHFAVGQWVECVSDHSTNLLKKGEFYRVGNDPHCNGCGVYIEEVNALFGNGLFRTVTWEVGATYELEVPGAFGKVLSIDEKGDIYGNITGQPLILSNYWHAKTGKDFNEQRGANLTPRRAVVETKSESIRREAAEALAKVTGDKFTAPNKVQITYETMPDPINPPHYQKQPSGVECIQVTEHMTFCLGNVVKYLWRAGQKGSAVQDLEKAAWYLDREIKRLKGGA